MREEQDKLSFRRNIRKGLLVTFTILGSLLMGIVALWNIELGEESLSSLWNRSEKHAFLTALALISCAMPCVAMRWRALLPRSSQASASPLFMTAILSSAFVLNLALPGPVGEAISAGMLSKRAKVSFADSIASLAVSRIIGLASSCLLAGLMWIFAPFPTPPEWLGILGATSGLLLSISFITALISFFPERPIRVVRFFLPKNQNTAADKLFTRIIEVILEILMAIQATTKRGIKPYCYSLFWAFSGHALVACGIAMAAQAGGTLAPWSAVIFTYAASIAGSVVMFLFPGSAVGWDVMFGTTLSITANISPLEAGAVTVVVRVQQMLVAIAGALALWWYGADYIIKQDKENSNEL